MLKSILILAAVVALLPAMVNPAYSAIYVWTDPAGIRNISNDARKIPSGVEFRTIGEHGGNAPAHATETQMSVAEMPASVTQTLGTETPRPATETLSGDVVTQGEFAVLLAAELGLGEGLSAQAAADRLSALRIAPRLGGWKLDEPMTQALFDRLSMLTVAAANESRVPIGVEEALFAFDSAVVLAGISKHTDSTAGVPGSSPPIVEEVLVPVHAPPLVVHRGVIFVGTHIRHGGFRKHHHGGFHKHRHRLKHKHQHGVRFKHDRHRAKARFRSKHRRGFTRHGHRVGQKSIGLRKGHHAKSRMHRPRFDSRTFRAHRGAHARALRGATRRGHVFLQRLGAGRRVTGRRGVAHGSW